MKPGAEVRVDDDWRGVVLAVFPDGYLSVQPARAGLGLQRVSPTRVSAPAGTYHADTSAGPQVVHALRGECDALWGMDECEALGMPATAGNLLDLARAAMRAACSRLEADAAQDADVWPLVHEAAALLAQVTQHADHVSVCVAAGALARRQNHEKESETMNDVQAAAALALPHFTTRERGEDSIVTLRDDAPQWVRDLVHHAHDEFLPDDWRYEAIYSAVEFLADEDNDPDDSHEWADGLVDVYNAARAAWLGSHLYRGGYCNEAVAEGLVEPEADIYDRIGVGQYVEAREVWGLVVGALRDVEVPA